MTQQTQSRSGQPTRPSAQPLGPAGTVVAGAGFAVNALAYVVPLLGARVLDPSDLGALAAALAIGALATVPGLGIQTALAVGWARHGRVTNAGRLTVVAATVTAVLLTVAVPVFDLLLRVPAGPSIAMAVTSVGVVAASRWLGQLQGTQRFARLGAGMVAIATARYGVVAAGLSTGLGLTGSLWAGAAAVWLVLPVLGWLARRAEPSPPPSELVVSGVIAGVVSGREVVSASTATVAMLAASYADLVLARHFLSDAESGAYAVGAVLTKGALWAPQVVTVLALPRLAQGSRRALAGALALVGACGAVLVMAAWLAGPLAISVVGGSRYADLSPYAVGFAASGACYAITFVLINAQIAASARFPAGPLWIALAALPIGVWLLHPATLGGIVGIAAAVAAFATAAMGVTVGITIAASRRSDPRPATDHAP